MEVGPAPLPGGSPRSVRPATDDGATIAGSGDQLAIRRHAVEISRNARNLDGEARSVVSNDDATTPDGGRRPARVNGYGEEVETPEALPGALERAMKAVDVDKRQAVLNVHTSYDDAAALADAKR